jgi:BirA family biotin operon repressor/biotin-[acetyl-CoA-carboxylase] ligase
VEAVGDAVIVGIGINVGVRKFPDELAEIATSVWRESGREIEREDLLEEVVKRMVHLVAGIEGEFSDLLDAWRQRCALTGKWVACLISEQSAQGLVRGVSEAGELLLEIDGQVRALLQADQIRVAANSRSGD